MGLVVLHQRPQLQAVANGLEDCRSSCPRIARTHPSAVRLDERLFGFELSVMSVFVPIQHTICPAASLTGTARHMPADHAVVAPNGMMASQAARVQRRVPTGHRRGQLARVVEVRLTRRGICSGVAPVNSCQRRSEAITVGPGHPYQLRDRIGHVCSSRAAGRRAEPRTIADRDAHAQEDRRVERAESYRSRATTAGINTSPRRHTHPVASKPGPDPPRRAWPSPPKQRGHSPAPCVVKGDAQHQHRQGR